MWLRNARAVNEMKRPRAVAKCLRVANDSVTNTLLELLHNVTGCLPMIRYRGGGANGALVAT